MPSHSIVQSVLLRRSAFKTLDEAKDWLVSHGYKYSMPDTTMDFYRFRQRDPHSLALTHRMRTTLLGDPPGSIGELIIAYPKSSSPMAPTHPGPSAAGGGPPAETKVLGKKKVLLSKEKDPVGSGVYTFSVPKKAEEFEKFAETTLAPALEHYYKFVERLNKALVEAERPAVKTFKAYTGTDPGETFRQITISPAGRNAGINTYIIEPKFEVLEEFNFSKIPKGVRKEAKPKPEGVKKTEPEGVEKIVPGEYTLTLSKPQKYANTTLEPAIEAYKQFSRGYGGREIKTAIIVVSEKEGRLHAAFRGSGKGSYGRREYIIEPKFEPLR